MVTDFFGIFLQELGRILQLPDLHPDSNNSCLIKFKGDIQIQLEMDHTGEYLIIGADFDSIPPGKYKERIFFESLRANGMPHPRYGTFAYSKQLDHLVLFEKIPVKDLNAQKVADFLILFMEKTRIWKEAITRGDVPVVSAPSSKGSSKGMFGLQ